MDESSTPHARGQLNQPTTDRGITMNAKKSTADSTKTMTESERTAAARRLARRIVKLTASLATARGELLTLLGPNERAGVAGVGEFQKVPAGWHPDAAFVAWLKEHRLLERVSEPRPTVSMRLVNEAAKVTPALLSYVTLARTAASERFTLRFKSNGDESV